MRSVCSLYAFLIIIVNLQDLFCLFYGKQASKRLLTTIHPYNYTNVLLKMSAN